jgi:CRISPR-associated protein Cas1
LPKDLHELPKLRDSLSYIYIEHAIIEQEDSAIVVIRKNERIPVPIASITVLMVGPGTNITHAAVKAVCDNGCMIVWCGENAMRYYGFGMGETRNATNLLHQARLCMNKELHLGVVRRMYQLRFPNINTDNLNIRQIRGLEGVRVREVYKQMGKLYGIDWSGRNYKESEWDAANPVNRALSAGNACLYGLCHAAIVSLGYSPGLGFIHTGKMLSFVYDVADLYKMSTTIPAAFEAVSQFGVTDIEREARIICRRVFKEQRILRRVADDINIIFDIKDEDLNINAESAGELWDGDNNVVDGGKNYANIGE